MAAEMHLAPIGNRDLELGELSDGVVANVMEHKEASMLPVITYGHFMWVPKTYDRERSFLLAAKECLGQGFMSAAQILMEFCYVSCINHMNHVKYRYLLSGDAYACREETVRYAGYSWRNCPI